LRLALLTHVVFRLSVLLEDIWYIPHTSLLCFLTRADLLLPTGPVVAVVTAALLLSQFGDRFVNLGLRAINSQRRKVGDHLHHILESQLTLNVHHNAGNGQEERKAMRDAFALFWVLRFFFFALPFVTIILDPFHVVRIRSFELSGERRGRQRWGCQLKEEPQRDSISRRSSFLQLPPSLLDGPIRSL